MLKHLFTDAVGTKAKDKGGSEGFNIKQFRESLKRDIATQHERGGATRLPAFADRLQDRFSTEQPTKGRVNSSLAKSTREARALNFTGDRNINSYNNLEGSATRNESFVSNQVVAIPNFLALGQRELAPLDLSPRLREARPSTVIGRSLASSLSRATQNSAPSFNRRFESVGRKPAAKGRENDKLKEKGTVYFGATLSRNTRPEFESHAENLTSFHKQQELSFDRKTMSLQNFKSAPRSSENLPPNMGLPDFTLKQGLFSKIDKIRETFNGVKNSKVVFEPQKSDLLKTANFGLIRKQKTNADPKLLHKSKLEVMLSENQLKELTRVFDGAPVDSFKQLPER